MCDAQDFLNALAGVPNPAVTFQTFDDKKPGLAHLARVRHGTLSEHRAELDQLNRDGAGVFVTINETDGHGRRKENVTGLRAVFVDDDARKLHAHDLLLRPSIVVRSVGGVHVYWCLEPGQPLDEFTEVQIALALVYGTDPTIKDLPRVMRVPGFLHNKTTAMPVTLLWNENRRVTLSEVKRAHKVVVKKTAAAAPPETRNKECSAPLELRARKFLERHGPAIEGSGGDLHTFKAAAWLVRDLGLDDATSILLLQEWNATCVPPWTDSELRKKIQSAHNSGSAAKGRAL